VQEKVAIILAHPDDELMCLPFISATDAEFFLFFLTSNSCGNSDRFSDAKNSVCILRTQGVEVHLVDLTLSVRDGHSYADIDDAFIGHLCDKVDSLGISSLITFEYEGGHQDHDVASVVTFLISRLKQLPISYFSGYRSIGFWLGFRTMKPKYKGSRISFSRIKVSLMFVQLLLVYRKEWKSWVSLGPGILFSYLFRPWFLSKGAYEMSRLPVSYLYEKRGIAFRRDVEENLFGRILKRS
jgi:hypothetical protein